MTGNVQKQRYENGRLASFNRAVFRAFFQEGRDIGTLEEVLQIAEKLDMVRNELVSGTQMDSYICRVLDDEEMTRQAEV